MWIIYKNKVSQILLSSNVVIGRIRVNLSAGQSLPTKQDFIPRKNCIVGDPSENMCGITSGIQPDSIVGFHRDSLG